jgi:uncharacterized membrane protein
MSDTESPHGRKQFQVDRIAFFSDAIMAIAMTLLILAFKIPPLGKNTTWLEVKDQFPAKFKLPVIGLLLCFFVIGSLWTKHHELFEHVANYNKRLISTNLRYLFCIMVLPITTSFMLERDNPWFLRYFFFFMNISLCNFFYYLLRRSVFSPKNNFTHLAAPVALPRDYVLLNVFVFGSSAILSLVSKSYFSFPLYLLFWPLLVRIFKWLKTTWEQRRTERLPLDL